MDPVLQMTCNELRIVGGDKLTLPSHDPGEETG